MIFSKVAVTVLVLITLDMLWFQLSMEPIYRPIFTRINGSSGYMNIPSALFCWVLIAIMINIFAKNKRDALLLGLLSYGIYNATNYATIKYWTASAFIADTLWGGVVCMLAYILLPKIMALSPI